VLRSPWHTAALVPSQSHGPDTLQVNFRQRHAGCWWRPTMMPRAPIPLRMLLSAAAVLFATGCGGHIGVASDSNPDNNPFAHGTGGAQGTGAAQGTGGEPGVTCHLDPPGTTFVFHVHNAGTQMLALAYGCGSSLPITLTTPAGILPIGPGDVSFCGFTCDSFYSGQIQEGCSDCGPGVGDSLPPGATADIQWDRRVWTGYTPDPQCVEGMMGLMCSLGSAVAPVATQDGALSVCAQGSLAGAGYCSSTNTMTFTIDTTKSEGTIEVQ
jgi:hypothetical protein